MSPAPASPTPWARVVALGLGVALVVGVLVAAFSWPVTASEPRQLPVALVAPDAVAEQLEDALAARAEGALDIRPAADRDEAVMLIETREVYGAIVVGETPEVLVTSAGSAPVAQLLTAMATPLEAQLQQAADAQAAAMGAPAAPDVVVAVTDVVPLVEADPRGAGLTVSAFPLVLGGMAGGIVIGLAVAGFWRRMAALAVYALAGGFVTAAVLQGWFQVLPGDYLLNSLTFALAFAAIGAPIVGFVAVLGRPGAALGPIVFLLFANPISSAAQPVQFLPEPWGAVGQWFPPGAAATLLRDVTYFPAADATFPWLVLAGWTVGGVVLAALGTLRRPRRAAGADAPEEPALAAA